MQADSNGAPAEQRVQSTQMSSSYTPPPPPSPYGYVPPPQAFQYPGAPVRKRRTWVIVLSVLGGVVVAGALFVAVVFAAVFGALRSSEPYQHAIQVANQDQRAIAVLGSPVTSGWFLSGNINLRNSSGNADLRIPVSGSRNKGTLYVVARKDAGSWTYETLDLTVEGQQERVNLLQSRNLAP